MSVRALYGAPFVSRPKCFTWTAYAIVKRDELTDVQENPNPEPERPLLQNLALEHEGKKQWASGETEWIWGDKQRGSFLKNEGGFVRLCLIGVSESTTIFWMNPHSWQWEMWPLLNTDYQKWVKGLNEKIY